MDYAIDTYFGNNVENAILRTDFVYDERRIYSKVYVLLKSIGLVFYTLSFTTCDKPIFFVVMNTVTFLSILNIITRSNINKDMCPSLCGNNVVSWKTFDPIFKLFTKGSL